MKHVTLVGIHCGNGIMQYCRNGESFGHRTLFSTMDKLLIGERLSECWNIHSDNVGTLDVALWMQSSENLVKKWAVFFEIMAYMWSAVCLQKYPMIKTFLFLIRFQWNLVRLQYTTISPSFVNLAIVDNHVFVAAIHKSNLFKIRYT